MVLDRIYAHTVAWFHDNIWGEQVLCLDCYHNYWRRKTHSGLPFRWAPLAKA